MHNNIMAAGSRDHPLMFATGRYAQWQSRFLRYIDTRPNGDALRKCILEVETIMNMSPENKAHFKSEKEATHLLLTGIGDEIYSTVDACKTTHEMWEAIERLQQVATMQVNVQFLQQLQPEWSRHKGKEIAKPIIPLSESAYEEDSDPEQAQKDKEMHKILALIAKYFKKLYKPTNNNLRTSLNTRNKNVDPTLSQVVQQTGIQCFNCNEFGHFAKECMKPKGLKTLRITRKSCCNENKLRKVFHYKQTRMKRLMNKNWKHITALWQRSKRQHSEQPKSTSNTCLVEKDDSNVTTDSPDMYDNDIQIDQNAEDERVTLANLIVNLKLDVDENKNIQK
ncbi:retrovirus-related pol polyprotein from transposon TNT 1-94 [Tanacetum coccineum]